MQLPKELFIRTEYEGGEDVKCCLCFPVKCGFLTLAIFQTIGIIVLSVVIAGMAALFGAVVAGTSSMCTDPIPENMKATCAAIETGKQKKDEGGIPLSFWIAVLFFVASMLANLYAVIVNYQSHCGADSYQTRVLLVKVCNIYFVGYALSTIGWIVAGLAVGKGGTSGIVRNLGTTAIQCALVFWWRLSAQQYADCCDKGHEEQLIA